MRVLVLDTETNGLDPADLLLEWAAALYLTEERTIIWAHSALVPVLGCKTLIPEINGITFGMLDEASWSRKDAYSPLVHAGVALEIDAIAAHNADFDRGFVEAALFPLYGNGGEVLPWIDTQELTYPRARGSQRLSHLCADHGLDGSQSHRALSDVLMLCELLGQVPDLDEQLATALLPSALFEAIVSYDDRELAKARGFRWVDRQWTKKLPLETDCEPTAERPFALRRAG